MGSTKIRSLAEIRPEAKNEHHTVAMASSANIMIAYSLIFTFLVLIFPVSLFFNLSKLLTYSQLITYSSQMHQVTDHSYI